MAKYGIGAEVELRGLRDIYSRPVEITEAEGLIHLQFRRFAGCPVCSLHLQSIIRRHDEIKAAGITELVVFHSSAEQLLKYHAEAPFSLIPDPEKRLYRQFGVEKSLFAILNPKSWGPMVKGIFRHGLHFPEFSESMIRYPADFLIDSRGRIVAVKYGTHAHDQWSVDELLNLAAENLK